MAHVFAGDFHGVESGVYGSNRCAHGTTHRRSAFESVGGDGKGSRANGHGAARIERGDGDGARTTVEENRRVNAPQRQVHRTIEEPRIENTAPQALGEPFDVVNPARGSVLI